VISSVVSLATSCFNLVNLFQYFKENFMSAPSRRPEIRRRRTRAEKVAKLRKRLAAASASTDKDRLTAKLHRVGLVSPGNPLLKSA
jgi:crotonobetainyl-CoA:carnitine CoA-transferase CaiB-like acyl-CoA transferase